MLPEKVIKGPLRGVSMRGILEPMTYTRIKLDALGRLREDTIGRAKVMEMPNREHGRRVRRAQRCPVRER